jgi:hypothetical protein
MAVFSDLPMANRDARAFRRAGRRVLTGRRVLAGRRAG